MQLRALLLAVALVGCGSKGTDKDNAKTDPKSRAGYGPTSKDALDPKVLVAQLSDMKQTERAAVTLENLADASTIPGIGAAWKAQGHPAYLLHTLIAIAKKQNAWDAAAPFMIEAVSEVDEHNPRSLDSAKQAAEALAQGNVAKGIPALAELANREPNKRLVEVQQLALRTLGTIEGDRPARLAALMRVVKREMPMHPRTARRDTLPVVKENYTIATITRLEAIRSLGKLQTPEAVLPLFAAAYTTPELFDDVRAALAASGPSAADLAIAILERKPTAIDALFADKKLDQYCGDANDRPVDECQPVSLRDQYAAIVLGDSRRATGVPALLAALDRPAVPVYYADDVPSPNTQHTGIYDALRSIGDATSAAPLRAKFAGIRAPRSGAPAPKDFSSKQLALDTYAFVETTTPAPGLDELAKIANDNGLGLDYQFHDPLRMSAAVAYARLARDTKGIATFDTLAKKYAEAAQKRGVELAQLKPAFDLAEVEFAKSKADYEKAKADAKAKLDALIKGNGPADQITSLTKEMRATEETFKAARERHRSKTGPFKQAEAAAKAYIGFGHMFQMHVARIEVAVRCKADLACFANTLDLTPEQVVANVKPFIPDVDTWTAEEKQQLLEASIERGMLELAKAGAAAAAHTGKLLDHVADEQRIIRQSILLALPKVAAVPCKDCLTKLDAAIAKAANKFDLSALTRETAIVRSYFAWAGGIAPTKTP